MQIRVSCPHCAQHAMVDTVAAGTAVACPACRQPFIVPTAPAVPPPPIGGQAAAPRKQNLWWLWVVIGLILVIPTTAFMAALFIPAFARAKARAAAIRERREAMVSPAPVMRPTLESLNLGPEFKVERDPVGGSVFVHSAREKRDSTGCGLYIADAQSPFPKLRLRCLRVGENRFTFEQAVFKLENAPGRVFTFKNFYSQSATQQRAGSHTFAFQDFDVSDGPGMATLQALTSAPAPVTLRLLGRTYEDISLTTLDLEGMRSVLQVWEKLRGLRPIQDNVSASS